MNNIYILKYNNYYNRVLRLASDLNGYSGIIYSELNANFALGDGVSASYVAGKAGNPYAGDGNYLICCDLEDNIVSRWFILDQDYLRLNQYKVQLRRDVVADSYEVLRSMPMFIDRAILPQTSPFIYNKEPGMTYNQIKMGEELIKDETNSAWVVGYYTLPDEEDIDATFSTDLPYEVAVNMTWADFVERYKVGQQRKSLANITNSFDVLSSSEITDRYWQYNVTNGEVSRTRTDNYNPIIVQTSRDDLSAQLEENLHWSFWAGYTESAVGNIVNAADLTYLQNLNGKVLRFSPAEEGGAWEYKKLWTQPIGTGTWEGTYDASLYNVVDLTSSGFTISSGSTVVIAYKADGYYWSTRVIQSYDEAVASVKIPRTARPLADAPYYMFAMPYNDVTIDGVTYKGTYGFFASQALARKYGGNSPIILDLQLLPYCPLRSIVADGGVLTLAGLTAQTDYCFIKEGDPWASSSTNLSVVLFPSSSQFTFDRTVDFGVNNDRKIANETEFYRLVSPNYNGQFDFNPAKNGNDVDKVNIDCTYKPFQPYIHINPHFAGLYGADYNDARGLICGGDFSLPAMSDAWATYERQNKNYQQIFDRQIQSMELNNNWELASSIAGAVTGTASGGAMGSLLALGPAGMAIGAAAGAIGGTVDVIANNALRTDQLELTKDQFSYQMGNIKALPNSLTKVSAYNSNNKIWPIIEYYSATDEEKLALARKIRQTSMAVGTIGTIDEFSGNRWRYLDIEDRGFIAGHLINATNLNEDYHFTANLNNELQRGIYLYD